MISVLVRLAKSLDFSQARDTESVAKSLLAHGSSGVGEITGCSLAEVWDPTIAFGFDLLLQLASQVSGAP